MPTATQTIIRTRDAEGDGNRINLVYDESGQDADRVAGQFIIRKGENYEEGSPVEAAIREAEAHLAKPAGKRPKNAHNPANRREKDGGKPAAPAGGGGGEGDGSG